MILINHSKQISITQNISRDTIIKLVKKRIKAARKRDTCYVGKQTNCKTLVRNNEILKSVEWHLKSIQTKIKTVHLKLSSKCCFKSEGMYKLTWGTYRITKFVSNRPVQSEILMAFLHVKEKWYRMKDLNYKRSIENVKYFSKYKYTF